MNLPRLNRSIVLTEDGSFTLFVPELNEHYHSIHGAIQESMHVYINAGLSSFVDRKTISILEVGFGTGLNALLTNLEAIKNKQSVSFTSIEKYPLSAQEIEKLNYASGISVEAQLLFKKLHDASWETYEEIKTEDSINSLGSRFHLKKINCDLLDFTTDEKFDLIYFDAFSPNAQPKLWSELVFCKMFECLQPQGMLVTYSAKGIVKRNLRTAGFSVKRLTGPPGKREMLRATKG